MFFSFRWAGGVAYCGSFAGMMPFVEHVENEIGSIPRVNGPTKKKTAKQRFSGALNLLRATKQLHGDLGRINEEGEDDERTAVAGDKDGSISVATGYDHDAQTSLLGATRRLHQDLDIQDDNPTNRLLDIMAIWPGKVQEVWAKVGKGREKAEAIANALKQTHASEDEQSVKTSTPATSNVLAGAGLHLQRDMGVSLANRAHLIELLLPCSIGGIIVGLFFLEENRGLVLAIMIAAVQAVYPLIARNPLMRDTHASLEVYRGEERRGVTNPFVSTYCTCQFDR